MLAHPIHVLQKPAVPIKVSERAIDAHGTVFIPRLGVSHPSLLTALQYTVIPLVGWVWGGGGGLTFRPILPSKFRIFERRGCNFKRCGFVLAEVSAIGFKHECGYIIRRGGWWSPLGILRRRGHAQFRMGLSHFRTTNMPGIGTIRHGLFGHFPRSPSVGVLYQISPTLHYGRAVLWPSI